MSNAEQRHIEEIEYYQKQLTKTKSQKRKNDLLKHINKLKKELKIYRWLRYKKN